ncbi:Acyl-CoA dehydrogenase [bioreactor metagenome]|uniref:Acyl-CoA dehydrogenase n=1 Tax=bioreactor metagenome TaxID=1076179 RepID=A0A645A1Z4_9ZZZZ
MLAFKTAPDQGSKGISVLVVEGGTPGLTVGPDLNKMGCRSSSTTSVALKDCLIPAENLLGKENGGFKVAMYGLVSGRLGMCSMGIGIAEACLEEAVDYANRRVAFGKPLAALYSVQAMAAEMHVKLEAARLMVNAVARRMDEGEDCALETSVAKLFVAETVDEVCFKAMQVFGGHGYLRNANVERYARDGRLMDIGVGASEVLKMVVGSAVLRSRA